jgi:hypothetical protein
MIQSKSDKTRQKGDSLDIEWALKDVINNKTEVRIVVVVPSGRKQPLVILMDFLTKNTGCCYPLAVFVLLFPLSMAL